MEPQQVQVSGQADVRVNVTVNAGSDLLHVVELGKWLEATVALNPFAVGHSGRMDGDAVPPPWGRPGGIGHR
jgi:hypothetical protein